MGVARTFPESAIITCEVTLFGHVLQNLGHKGTPP